MFSEIKIYLQLGFEHILDFNGYDHLLFLLAMCAMYTLKDWKKVLILVTAFTVGHSLTLALVVNDILAVSGDWVEFLIPLTIALTAIYDLLGWGQKYSHRIKYTLAILFGLVHGMGFSNYLKALLGDEGILLPLLSFNIGLELGQVLFVVILLLLSYLVVDVLKLKKQYWSLALSALALVVSVYLMSQRIGGIL